MSPVAVTPQRCRWLVRAAPRRPPAPAGRAALVWRRGTRPGHGRQTGRPCPLCICATGMRGGLKPLQPAWQFTDKARGMHEHYWPSKADPSFLWAES